MKPDPVFHILRHAGFFRNLHPSSLTLTYLISIVSNSLKRNTEYCPHRSYHELAIYMQLKVGNEVGLLRTKSWYTKRHELEIRLSDRLIKGTFQWFPSVPGRKETLLTPPV